MTQPLFGTRRLIHARRLTLSIIVSESVSPPRYVRATSALGIVLVVVQIRGKSGLSLQIFFYPQRVCPLEVVSQVAGSPYIGLSCVLPQVGRRAPRRMDSLIRSDAYAYPRRARPSSTATCSVPLHARRLRGPDP